MTYTFPSIYKDTIVGYFLNEVVAIDANDGSEIWAVPADGFVIGAAPSVIPTIHNFAAHGEDVTLIFVGGGDAKSFQALNLTDGSTRWTRNFMAHSMHFMSFTPNVIVDIGGVPVIVYSDDNGDIYAVEALSTGTGNLYTGWATNPINLGGPVQGAMCTDGVNIYVGTMGIGIGPGEVVALDAATGTALWSFTDLQLENIETNPDYVADGTVEEFNGSICFDASENAVFAVSSYDKDFTPAGAYICGGGILYKINGADGSLLWAAPCNQPSNAGTIAIDASQVITAGWNDFGFAGFDELRPPLAYNKATGSFTFKHMITNPGPWDYIYHGPLMSCEPEIPDWMVTQSRLNFVGFFKSDNGAMMFHRRWSGNTSLGSYFGHPNSPIMDANRMYVPYRHRIVALTTAAKAARPRLDLTGYFIDAVVPFGMPDHYMVTVEGVIGNTGGADLTIDDIFLVEEDNGGLPPGEATAAAIMIIDGDRLERLDKLARMYSKTYVDLKEIESVEELDRATRNHSAFAIPSWVYGIVAPTPGTVIPPQGSYNDSSNYIDIVVEIDGTQVPRGATDIFVEIYTDDPDYFIDSSKQKADGSMWAYPADSANYLAACVQITLVGGCLYDDVILEFGIDAANYWHIWNAPKIADGDIGSAEIDGDGTSMWQAGMLFATAATSTPPAGKVSCFTPKLYMFHDTWGYPDNWESLLPDPNCYDATCPPNHRTDVLLGEISNDGGGTYDPVYGEVVAYAFVDSGQDICDYDTLDECAGWNWNDVGEFTPPYADTLTTGFHGCVEVIGAYDEPLLNNFIIQRMELSGRYGPVNDLYMGMLLDIDIPPNAYNTAGYDEAHSLAFGYCCNTNDNGWGVVKIPFGCGYDPLRGAKTLSANQAAWNDSMIVWDSAYCYLTTMDGLSHQPGTDPDQCSADPDDREVFYSVAALDLPQQGSGTTSIGLCHFGMPDITDANLPETYFGLANVANMWCGFGRGDVNNDGNVDLVDVAYMIDYVYYEGDGPFPFKHQGDVNISGGDPDAADVTYLINYYFYGGECLLGEWTIGGYVAR